MARIRQMMVVFVQYKGDTSIANFTWGGGVTLVVLYTLFATGSFLPRQIMLTTMIVLWAARLIIYLYKRYTGRDPRFASWQWQGLKALGINIIWIFGQSIMIAIMSYPIVLVNLGHEQGLTRMGIFGLIMWVIGFLIEMISDHQLFIFMNNPQNKGHVITSGLWRYSRYPNYFGEIVMWWGIYAISLSEPYGWTAIITPLTITFLLVFVTGIPWIEKTMENNAEYQEYKQKTSKLIPWFSKKYY